MTLSTLVAPKSRWLDRAFQIRLPVFVVIVALVALVSWAGRWYLETRDPYRTMTRQQVRDLASADLAARRSAANLLDGVYPSLLAEVAPALMKAMKDPDATVRQNATRSLASSVSFYFAVTNGQAPPERDRAALALIGAMRDADPQVRASAIRGLQSFTYAVNVSLGPKGNAFRSLGFDPKVAGPPLRAALNDPDPKVAMAALRAMQSIKLDPGDIRPQLRRMARAGDRVDRGWAIWLLASALKDKGEPPDEIIAFLDDPDEELRSRVLEALGQFGRDDARTPRILADLLPRCRGGERPALIHALASLKNTPDSAVPALIRALEEDGGAGLAPHERETIREAAPEALRHASPAAARAALPALLTAGRRLRGRDAESPALPTMAEAIATIAPDSAEAREAISWLVALARSAAHPTSASAAVRALGHLAPRNPGAVAALRDALQTKFATVGIQAEAILAMLGDEARPTPGELLRAARFELAHRVDASPTYAALFALAPDSPEAGAFLIDVIEGEAGLSRPEMLAGILADLRARAIDPAPALRAYRAAYPGESARVDAALKALAAR